MNYLIYSTHTEANIGDHVHMKCFADIIMDLSWEFNQMSLPRCVKKIGDYEIDINPVHLNNSGSYICNGYNDYTNFLATAKLKVFGKFMLIMVIK